MATQPNNGHVESMNGYSTSDLYTTSKGASVRFIGLNPARLDQLQSAGKAPAKPVREIPNDLGAPQKEELSEKDLQTDEERAAWADYKQEMAKLENKRNENVMKYVFNDGFAVDDSEIEEWKRQEEEEYGIIPEGTPLKIRMDFINARVIGNSEDLANIMAGVLERTGVPADKLDEVKDTFRGTVRQNTAPEVDGEERTEGQLELE